MSAPARALESGSGASGFRDRERVWEESNCYLDVLTGLLLEFGHDPEPALAVTLSGDWEGDQWTFCKFNDEDLRVLYGLDIQELNPWNDLHDHVVVQLRAGHAVLIEVDSWFLPDTRGSTYHQVHAKTTIAVLEIDPAAERMVYLHGSGKHQLDSIDYRGIWRLDSTNDVVWLPPYVERVRRGQGITRGELPERALRLLRRELSRVPSRNPVAAFLESVDSYPTSAAASPLEFFHRFAFATFRQIGANSELFAYHLRWLACQGVLDGGPASGLFLELARAARAEQFKFARCVSRGRSPELSSVMAELWGQGVDAVGRLI